MEKQINKNSTIQLIQLLTDISNGSAVPYKIRYNNIQYIYDPELGYVNISYDNEPYRSLTEDIELTQRELLCYVDVIEWYNESEAYGAIPLISMEQLENMNNDELLVHFIVKLNDIANSVNNLYRKYENKK